MNALVLVDLQYDFLPGGSLAVPHGNEVVPIANHLQPFFDIVVATQDWHPSDHQSFADNHPGKNPGDEIQRGGLRQILWPRHCIQHTPGARLTGELNQQHIAAVVQKGTDRSVDSYSGFFDNGYCRATGLGDILRLKGAQDVYVMGLATDYCVKHTAIDARKLAFPTHVITDGCRGVELQPGDVRRALDEMQQAGVVLVSSGEVPSRLAKQSADTHVVAQAKFLRLVRRGPWEFVQRRGADGVIVVIALTNEGRVLLVEQRRPPVNDWVVELPAGLAGDDEGLPQESLAAAARRELIEETGYDAGRIEQVFEGPSSAGLTDEIVTFLVATDLVKIAPGGGVGGENIVVHEIPRESVFPWIESRRREGRMVDARLYTGLYLLDHVLPRNA